MPGKRCGRLAYDSEKIVMALSWLPSRFDLAQKHDGFWMSRGGSSLLAFQHFAFPSINGVGGDQGAAKQSESRIC